MRKQTFKVIENKDAIAFVLPRHYSGRKPNVSVSFGYYENDELKGVCTFGKPASNQLCIGVCGKEYSSQVFELNRLCVEENTNIVLSKFVGFCLRNLKERNWIIVSYADEQMNHKGYIYQATNWIYTGKTKSRTDKYVEGNKHSRHYNKNQDNSKRKFRSSKHRYLYFACSKSLRKKYYNSLKYKVLQYPKGYNGRYTLGEYIKPIVIHESTKVR